MKRIIALCAAFALLAPAYAFARGGYTMGQLQRQWEIEEAQEKQELPHIRALEAEGAKAIKDFGGKHHAAPRKPIYSK